MVFRIHHCLLLLACFPALIQRASAQSHQWRTVEIGGCGFVTGTVFHHGESGLVYARTDVGGAYRMDSTTNNRWVALNDDIGGLNNEFQHLGVQTIGLDPNDPNRVYIATGQYAGTESWKLNSRIYRSTNRGATWSYVTPGFKMAGNGEGRGTGERMAVDPLNGANILVGSNNLGIWRSTDYGVTWARLANFPSTLTNLNFLLFAPASAPGPGPNRRVYAAANTLTGQSFWFSDDNGNNWSEVPNHPGKTVGQEMMPLQGSFDAAGVFYSTWGNATGPSNYATDYGVWKMSADGSTWTSILPPTGQGFFGGISADPNQAGHVVVSTLLRWWPGDEVYRSTDGGATWTAALRTATKSLGNSPWANPGPHWITDIDIDPFNSNRAIFNTGFGLFQTTNLSSSGAARNWTFFNDGLEEAVPLGLHSPTAGPPLISVIGDYTGFRHDDLNRSPLRGALSPGSGSTSVITGADLAPAKVIRQNSGTTLYSQDAAATWASFPSTPAPIINGHNRVVRLSFHR
jgi:xyloglucan-specific exo-beta-1,4-glucanase